MKTFVTFGQVHSHIVNGKSVDKDCVAVIEAENAAEGRNLAFRYFGDKFFTTYFDKPPEMQYFPNGFVHVN